jgi:cobalt/nickel transport system permease protein
MGPLPWAVHISDGVLSLPWLAGGFAGMAILMLAASYRVRDEEIPRIALLTAAFFVASLIHFRIGPTSVHLLLNGLVGVVLGRRAGLAIPVGLLLQAVLLGHGGISALGVNACVLTLPALAAGGLFGLLHRPALLRQPWFRSGLVFCSAAAWLLCLVFSLSLLFTNRVTGIGGLDAGTALRITFHPGTLAAATAVALAAAWLELREGGGPEFASGVALGVFAVLATVALNAAVLLWGGAEDWHALALIVFAAHLPIAALEGIVLGFTVSFLARVKPEMLGAVERPEVPHSLPDAPVNGVSSSHSARQGVRLPSIVLLAVAVGLAAPGTVHAHRLEAEYRVLPDGWVQVESWFDLTGESPQGAGVQVFRQGGELLIEGKLDEKGLFAFLPQKSEPLKVVVSAGAGHRKELVIPESDPGRKERSVAPEQQPVSPPAARADDTFADRSPRVTAKDVLVGIAFLLALAAFVLSVRNSRALRDLRRGD